MANPQVENGYVRIATEIFEALCRIRINGEARQVFDVVFRKTYGFNKKEDRIALSQFVEATGLKKPTVCKALNKLKEMNLVIVTQKDNEDNIFQINKNFETWRPLPKKITDKKGLKSSKTKSLPKKEIVEVLPKKEISVTQKDNSSLPKKPHTIDNTTIDTITIDRESGASAPTPKENAERFFNGVLALVRGEEVPWLKELLIAMAEKNDKVTKAQLWNEIKKFCGYWTERNSTGKREKWQMQKTFEVDRRLATWFSRAGFSEFSASGFAKKSKGKEIIGL